MYLTFAKNYIGKTGSMVNICLKEHDNKLKHTTQSTLSKHNIKTGH